MNDQPKRGLCPVCRRDMQLTKDGTLRHHGGPKGSAEWGRRAYRCPGAGRTPAAR